MLIKQELIAILEMIGRDRVACSEVDGVTALKHRVREEITKLNEVEQEKQEIRQEPKIAKPKKSNAR